MNRWFSVRLILACEIEDAPERSSLLEESTRLVLAQSEAEAIRKAEALGKSSEHQYTNDRNEMVRWQFQEVAEVQDLGESSLFDGMEVWSRMVEKPE